MLKKVAFSPNPAASRPAASREPFGLVRTQTSASLRFTMYPVEDPERARDFYEKKLGLSRGSSAPNGDWTEYDLPGGGCLALFRGSISGLKPTASAGSIAFEVEDLDALNERLKAEGVTYSADMIHSPVCRMSVILDSEGNSIILHQLARKD